MLSASLSLDLSSLGGFLLAAQSLLFLRARFLGLCLFLLAPPLLFSLGFISQKELLLELLLCGVRSLSPALEHRLQAVDERRMKPPVVLNLGVDIHVCDDLGPLVHDGLHLQVKDQQPLLRGDERRGHLVREALKLPAYLHGLRGDVTARFLPRSDRRIDLFRGMFVEDHLRRFFLGGEEVL